MDNPKPSTLSDEAVLALSLEHPSAFSIIFNRYYAPLRRKAVQILSDEEMAEDAVQESLVRIYRYAHAFKKVPSASFRSWAYKILVRQCFTIYRKRKRESLRTTAIDEELEAVLADVKDDTSLDLDEFNSVALRMPEGLRAVLRYAALGGKTIADIAKLEGISVGAVRTRLSRARKEFHRLRLEMV